MILLFPSDYFDKNQVDADLKEEYQTAENLKLYQIILFDYEKFFHENQIRLSQKPENPEIGIYRGWMMKPEQYQHFYQELLKYKIKLLNTPEQYQRMHLFPEIYPELKEDTAEILLYPLYEKINIRDIKFEQFMIKDYVKSLKDPRFQNYFDQNTSQEDFENYMQNFYQYRGDLLTGGICIKKYLDLKFYQNHKNEYRVFYAGHEILSVCRNSGQEETAPVPPENLIKKYQNLDSNYYTLDFAELSDHSWKILESGDGSVSGLAETEKIQKYYQKLYQLLSHSGI